MSGREKVIPMKNRKLLATTAFALEGISPAFAQTPLPPTTAGTDITLSATVDYTIGTASQSYLAPEVKVKIDRVVIMSFTSTDTGSFKTDVSPKKKAWSRVYLKNSSNDKVDFQLTMTDADGTSAPAPVLYRDVAPEGFGPEDVNNKVTNLSNVAQEAVTYLLMVIDVPETATNGTTYNYNLAAKAYPAGTVNNQGATPFSTSATQDDAAVDTVLAEGTGTVTGDGTNDGVVISRSTFTVKAPVLTAINVVNVISDPYSTTNPGAIPGAVVRYCMGWQNAANAGAASNVVVTSILPDTVTLDQDSVKPGKYVNSACVANANITLNQVITADNDFEVHFTGIGAGENAVAIFDAKIK